MDKTTTEHGKLITYAAGDYNEKFLVFLSADSKVISFYSNGKTWEQTKEPENG
jgi:hypothetical protein